MPPAPSDQEDLRHFGYAQELFRSMGGFSNFAISLSIICILAGGITSFHHHDGHGRQRASERPIKAIRIPDAVLNVAGFLAMR